MRRRAPAVLALGLGLAAAACDTGDGRELRPPTASERAAVPTTTTTTQPLSSLPLDAAVSTGSAGATTVAAAPSIPATVTTAPGAFGLQTPWAPGGPIDARFTCDGAGVSPAMTWTAPPAGTVELVLLVTDDDAQGFVHWAVVGIPPTAGQVGEDAAITGGREGSNDFAAVGWDGPCPPGAGETHTYRFALYALGQQPELVDVFTGDELLAFAQATALGYAESTGTYTRAA